MMRSRRWALSPVIFWSLVWAWATSLGCCRMAWQTAACTAWNWTALPGALPRCCIRRPTLLLLALRPPTAVISTIWRWATCLSVSTKSTIKRTTSWDFPSTIIFLQKPSTKCVRAAWWRSSPAATPWTARTAPPASTWQSVPICWVPSVCRIMRSVLTPAQMSSVILSFCKSVIALRTLSRTGYSLARPRTALPSTSIS